MKTPQRTHVLPEFLSSPRSALTAVAALLLAAGLATRAPATIVTVPTDLNPGNHYRLVFVTDGTIKGTTALGGPTTIGGYNTFGSSAATAISSLQALGTTWSAVVSFRETVAPNTTTVAKTNTGTDPSVNGTGVPIYNLAGLRVANNNTDLWDGSISNPIDVTQTGAQKATNTMINTGTLSNGRSGTDYWMGKDPGGSYMGLGRIGDLNTAWVQVTRNDGSARPIYVISGDLTVASPLSPDCDITSLTWSGYTGVIDEIANPKTIVLHVPYGTPLNLLNPNPTFIKSPGSTCNKNSGGAGEYDFTTTQTYTVNAADGINSKSYQVSVVADISTVTLGVSPSTISEDAGTATVTATLSNAYAQDVTVNLSFAGTAVAGTNYTSSGTSITIPATQMTGTVTITGVQDNFYGPDRTAVVSISTVMNGLVGTPSSVTATITNTTTQPAGLPHPSGINPSTGQPWQVGDQYQLAFVTSTTHNATSTDISTYNTFVNTVAGTSTLPDIANIQWFAIGSTASAVANVNALVTVPVLLVDGTTVVATGYTDMWDGSLTHGIDKDQSGNSVAAGTAVWTGCVNANGTPANYPTGPFYQSLGYGGGYSRWGQVDGAAALWITVGEATSGTAYPLYALSGPLTNTVAPPTITVTLGVDQATIAEDAGQTIVTATLSDAAPFGVTVNLALSGTAVLGTNYTAAPGTSIVIAAGQASGSVTLTGIKDGIYRGANETIVIKIGSVINALENGTQQETVTIIEGDAQPTGLPRPVGINPATGEIWQPGDLYQLVCVTNTTTPATSEWIATYNQFVNVAAAASTLPGIPNIAWKAIGSALSDPTTPANVNAPVVAPVYLLDGTTKVANGYSDMWDGTIANPINIDVNGASVAGSVPVWTGSSASGTSMRPLGKVDGYVQHGLTAGADGTWISAAEQHGGSQPMYALSIPLTHPGGTLPVAPLAPTITSITPGTGTLSVNFTPAYDGGAAISNYKYSTDNGVTWAAVAPAATTSPIAISGLINGTTYQVKVLAVNSVSDGAPSTAVSGTPDAGLTGYALWASTNGASADPTADSNHNGVSNGIEFFMGGTQASPATLPPLVDNHDGTWTWTIPYDPAAAAACTYAFETSATLSPPWSPIVAPDTAVDDATNHRFILTLHSGPTKKFARLVVTPN